MVTTSKALLQIFYNGVVNIISFRWLFRLFCIMNWCPQNWYESHLMVIKVRLKNFFLNRFKNAFSCIGSTGLFTLEISLMWLSLVLMICRPKSWWAKNENLLLNCRHIWSYKDVTQRLPLVRLKREFSKRPKGWRAWDQQDIVTA